MILEVLRYTVFGVFVGSGAVALASWAVRTRRISPFSTTGQAIRKLTDPVLSPIEIWQLRRGGNPQNAGWWLLGLSLVGGILVITLAEGVIGVLLRMARAAAAGPRQLVRFLLYATGQLVSFALIARVIGSWFGVGRYNRWMRHAYTLTDWIVEPLRRMVPPIGMIDITPFVAWILLQLILGILMGVV